MIDAVLFSGDIDHWPIKLGLAGTDVFTDSQFQECLRERFLRPETRCAVFNALKANTTK